LVVVENRDPEPLAQLALDQKAFGRLDVLEVDGAEGRLERRDDLDELRRIALVELDVEAVDAGELLEEHGLPLHDRLGGERADGAEAEHGRSVGHHPDQVRARRELGGELRVAADLLAGRRYAGRIREREIALIRDLLGREDGDLPRGATPVILERVLLQLFIHRKIIIPLIARASLIAERAEDITPFQGMDVLARAHALEAAGRRVFHMEIGAPDFAAPAPVVEAGVRALRDGLTAYTATL